MKQILLMVALVGCGKPKMELPMSDIEATKEKADQGFSYAQNNLGRCINMAKEWVWNRI